MKTAKQVFEQICQQKHYGDAEQMLQDNLTDWNTGRIKNIIYEAMEAYANQTGFKTGPLCSKHKNNP